MRVILDAGHGIDTPGKRSPDGTLREYLWNRQVADLVEGLLTDKGIPVVQIVTETNDIPLRTRILRTNKIVAEESGRAVFISIHANAAGDGREWKTATGWSCYTTPRVTRSDELAECMYDAFEQEFPDRRIRKDLTDGDRDYEADFAVIKGARCPAVLLENFFYDNKEECEWMKKDSTKRRIATAIVNGLLIYLSEPF